MSSTVPVILVPARFTKTVKSELDSVQWRDKSKLITRLSQVVTAKAKDSGMTCDESQDNWLRQLEHYKEQTGFDLTQLMAMALLPHHRWTQPQHRTGSLIESVDSADTGDRRCYPLDEFFQQQLKSSDHATSPAELLLDTATLKLLYLTWIDSARFTTPRHLLAQTPLEKLQHSLGVFLTPILQAWTMEEGDRLGPQDLPSLLASVPQKWEHYSEFTLLPPTAFLEQQWPALICRLYTLDRDRSLGKSMNGSKEIGEGYVQKLEKIVQESLQSSHIARKAIIPVEDVLRRPKIRPLAGDWGIHNQFKSWIEDNDIGHIDHKHMAVATYATPPSALATNHGSNPQVLDPSSASSTTLSLTSPIADDFAGAFWSMTAQNHVWYAWAPMFTMFSAGNITEKERVAHSRPIFDARDKVVVDLYAGIGYFALVYLVHAQAKQVHACEWNPWSVEGLARGADRNGISWRRVDSNDGGTSSHSLQATSKRTLSKKAPSHPLGELIIYPGDNAQWIQHFENQAHHVNLGLIPSAEEGWVLGVRALSPHEGGYLHIHHNIRVGEEEVFKKYLIETLTQLFREWKSTKADGALLEWSVHIRHMENVKSFAPLVFHYVADVECRPVL